MSQALKTRLWIAAMIYPMANAVLFGLGVVPVLSIPALADNAWYLFPVVVAASFTLAAPIAWFLAPHLRSKRWHEEQHQREAAAV